MALTVVLDLWWCSPLPVEIAGNLTYGIIIYTELICYFMITHAENFSAVNDVEAL